MKSDDKVLWNCRTGLPSSRSVSLSRVNAVFMASAGRQPLEESAIRAACTSVISSSLPVPETMGSSVSLFAHVELIDETE